MRALVVVLLLAGCGDTVLDTSGTYEGTASRTGETGRMITDIQPDGTLTADTRRFTTPEPSALCA